MSIENFIDALAAGDKMEAEAAFNAEMGSRINDAIDAKRVEVGQSIYGQPQTEEE